MIETEPVEPRPDQEPNLGPLARLALYIPCWIFVSFAVVGVIFLLAAFVIGAFGGDIGDIGEEALAAVTTDHVGPFIVVTDAFHVALTLGFLWLIDRKKLKNIGLDWSPVRAHQLVVGLLVGASFVAVMLGSYWLVGWMRFESVQTNWLGWVLSTLLVYPMIGFAEELVFRGYVMTNLEEWRGRAVAIGGSSILFWMVHLGGGNVHEPLGVATMIATAVVFALARYGSGGLWLPIGLHVTYDWAAISLTAPEDLPLPALFKGEVLVEGWLVGAPGYAGLVDLLWVLALLAVVWLFLLRRRRYHDTEL